MKTLQFLPAAAISILLAAGCSSASRTERSAAVGAATGAIVGGVIGNQSGNPRTGAAIGAAVGGVAGGAYGHSQEQRSVSGGSSSSDDYYLSLMTPDEVDVLRARARASGRSDYRLTDFLTDQERENLRRRDASRREIGR
ncbi:hypothetical protein DB347_15615 [Opitutaceae bacterium EW11]|nr:hypothetical protein DB347_15615 [Opitutaceae bacterium EW11]